MCLARENTLDNEEREKMGTRHVARAGDAVGLAVWQCWLELWPAAAAKDHIRSAAVAMRRDAVGGGSAEAEHHLTAAAAVCERQLLVAFDSFRYTEAASRCRRLRAAPPPLRTGLSDFSLLRRFGKGSYGEVYAARKEDTLALLALKVCSSGE